VSNSEMDDGTRIQAIDLIRTAIGRLECAYENPQASPHHSEAKIALRDLNSALKVLNKLGNPDHQQVLPDLRLLVHRLEISEEQTISEAHDDILEACLLIEDV
jgi:hypothetical protein